ncbi:MAG TPA: extracellular solute-binding protein [Terriglobales bacterium]|nr:extracellular solute-binding protein [Terriglobales bacterium]
MRLNRASAPNICCLIILCAAVFYLTAFVQAQSIDETYKQALKEGGPLNVYGTLTPDTAMKVLPMFEKRFPGIKTVNTGASSDKIVARAISEARGGRTIGDVFHMNLENVMQVHEQGLVLEKLPPEADVFASHLKGTYWVATRFNTLVAAWNTQLVSKADEPKSFEEFAEPKWQGKLLAEPRDAEFLIAFAEQKYKSADKAVALFKRIAANNVEFHSGHPQLVELLIAGQGSVCITCYTHHLLPRMQKGGHLDYLRSLGIGLISATAVFKNAPHPNTAWLFHRWAASDEGQKAFGIEGRVPANPKVEPAEAIGLTTVYGLGEKEYHQFAKYEKIWKQIFSLR